MVGFAGSQPLAKGRGVNERQGVPKSSRINLSNYFPVPRPQNYYFFEDKERAVNGILSEG